MKLKCNAQGNSKLISYPFRSLRSSRQTPLLSTFSSIGKVYSLLKSSCINTIFVILFFFYLPLDWLPLINPLSYQKGVKIVLCSSQLLAGYWALFCLFCIAMPLTKTLTFWLNTLNSWQHFPFMRSPIYFFFQFKSNFAWL